MFTRILIFGILFILFALIFIGIATFFTFSEKTKNDTQIRFMAKFIYIIGVVTLILGIMLLAFIKEMTNQSFRLILLVYLAALTIILSIFSLMIKENNK